MASVYSAAVPLLIQDLERTFTNEFHLTQPFLSDDILPGERYGVMAIDTYARDPDRPLLQRNRGGAESKEIRATVVIKEAFDATGMTNIDAKKQAESLFLQWCFDLEHGFSQMRGDINNGQFVYDVDLGPEPIDRAYSVYLKDENAWVVGITAIAVIKLMVCRSIEGEHVLPL
jgi:hypothetical protein